MTEQESGRWVPLRQYLSLKRGRQPELALSFRQIEEVLGDGLPKPARKYPEWWHNDRATTQARAWLDAGWHVRDVDLVAETVVFQVEERA